MPMLKSERKFGPVNLLKVSVRTLFKLLFRIEVHGLENYAATGERVLIVCNHVSLLDGMLLYLFLPDRPTFAINTFVAQRWVFKPLFLFVDLFVMDPLNPMSMKKLIGFIRAGNKAVIFPEGRLTTTGAIMKIYEGPGLIAEKARADILPIGIEGAQFSKLSNLKGIARTIYLPRITLHILQPLRIGPQANQSGRSARQNVTMALADVMLKVSFATKEYDLTLYQAQQKAARRHGLLTHIARGKHCKSVSYWQILARSLAMGAIIADRCGQREVIGVLLPNGIDAVICLLAITHRRRVAALLDPAWSVEHLQACCERGGITSILCSRKTISSAGLEAVVTRLAARCSIRYLEDLRPRFPLGSYVGVLRQHLLGVQQHPRADSETAVILFERNHHGAAASELSHRSLLANSAQLSVHYALNHNDVVYSAYSMAHGFGLIVGVLLPARCGAKIYFTDTSTPGKRIPDACYHAGASVLVAPARRLQEYLRSAHPYDFREMRYALTASRVNDGLLRRWQTKFGKRIYPAYASAATGVLCANSAMFYRPGTVGRFLPQIEYQLHDESTRAGRGRLRVRGPNIACAPGKEWFETIARVSIDNEGFLTLEQPRSPAA